MRTLLTTLLLLTSWLSPVYAQLGDVVATEHVVTAARDGYTISGLVTRLPEAHSFKRGIIQFPGYPSIMRLRVEEGSPVFELQSNSLVRGRKLWLDEETMVLTVDAPSDQWASFDHWFRRSSRYGKDIAALIAAVSKQYAVGEWAFVGHSEGAVSAYGAARAHTAGKPHLVLISSLFMHTHNGPGLSGLDWDMFNGRLLWVHHEEDLCRHTPYREAKNHASKTNSPLLTLRGGENRGDSCRAYGYHGFPGLEEQVFAAIKDWIKTGKAVSSVGP